MATYKLKDDFINGVLPNTNGKPNILFKKGDIIDGTITEKFVFNTMMKGIMSKPTVVGARVEEDGGLVFVPFQYVKVITNINDNVGIATIKPESSTKSDSPFSSKLLGAYNKNLIIAIVLVACYFAYKKFKN